MDDFPGRHSTAIAAPIFAALLGACAHDRPVSLAQLDDERQVCRQEARLGSMLPSTSCRSLGQMGKDREEAQKNLNFIRTSGPEGDRSTQ